MSTPLYSVVAIITERQPFPRSGTDESIVQDPGRDLSIVATINVALMALIAVTGQGLIRFHPVVLMGGL